MQLEKIIMLQNPKIIETGRQSHLKKYVEYIPQRASVQLHTETKIDLPKQRTTIPIPIYDLTYL